MNAQILKKLAKEEAPSTDDKSLLPSESESIEYEVRKNKAMEEAFQIPDILQEIIENVKNLNDLKQCRRVNSMWKETTTEVILKRNLPVVLNYNLMTLKYQKVVQVDSDSIYHPTYYYAKDKQDVENSVDLATLKEIVDKSTQFPCSTFIIHQIDLTCPLMKNLLQVVGLKKIHIFHSMGKTVKFGVLLELNCLTLETLNKKRGHIKQDHIPWISNKISVEITKLNMLEGIYLHEREDEEEQVDEGVSPFKILKTLVVPDLQVILGFDLSRDLEAVFNAEKIHCVKELNFGIGDPDDLIKLEILVKVGPQLETLNLHLLHSLDILENSYKSRWMSLIQKLLDMSQTTLKYFSFGGIEKVYDDLNFPRFPQLREIEIDSRATIQQGVRYPYEILGNNISPNLQVIKGFDLLLDARAVGMGISLVKKLNFCLFVHQRSLLSLFLTGGPKLESLELYWERNLQIEDLELKNDIICLLQQLLGLSKDTLRNFEYEGVGTIFEDMEFPQFSKLQSLNISADNPVRVFPRGINLAETFPKLQILDLKDCPQLNENWDFYFPPPDAFKDSLTAVNTLLVNDVLSDDTKTKMKLICPNATLFRLTHNW